jgi:hypothetical protein
MSNTLSDGNLVTQLGNPAKSLWLRSTFHTSPAHGTETAPPRRCGNGLPPPPSEFRDASNICSLERRPHPSMAGRELRQFRETFKNVRHGRRKISRGISARRLPDRSTWERVSPERVREQRNSDGKTVRERQDQGRWCVGEMRMAGRVSTTCSGSSGSSRVSSKFEGSGATERSFLVNSGIGVGGCWVKKYWERTSVCLGKRAGGME